MTDSPKDMTLTIQDQAAFHSVEATEVFERHRPHLEGLVYRMLGSRAEVDDVIQDTFVKWWETPKDNIRVPESWLTTVAPRLAIDALKSARLKRTDYYGEWLPEPISSQLESEQESRLERASTLSTAFLYVLERLSPRERAAFLLKDVFGYPHAIVAEVIGVSEAGSRKLVSRAKTKVSERDVRTIPNAARQKTLINAFESAINTGETEPLKNLLAEDVRLLADGGGKVAAIGRPIFGGDTLFFITNSLREWWSAYSLTQTRVNGLLGLSVYHGQQTVAVVSFGFDKNARVQDVQIMRNPDKLKAFAQDSF
jgi:RNA polymerase sigma-70 factor (ECF subfamily)